MEEEKHPKSVKHAKHVEPALRVLEDVMLKSSLILNTFDVTERFNEVATYQKESFDLLWRVGKIVKPIVSFFIPAKSLFLLDSSIMLGRKKASLTVYITKKSTSFELTKELIEDVRRAPRFEGMARKLVENYEVVASNLVGHADACMRGYNSKVSLFKYAMALAQEGEVLEQTEADVDKVRNRYLQALLVLSLLTKAHYDQTRTKPKYLECELLSFELLDERGNIVGENKELDEDVDKMLGVNKLSSQELSYLERVKAELALRCKKLLAGKPTS